MKRKGVREVWLSRRGGKSAIPIAQISSPGLLSADFFE